MPDQEVELPDQEIPQTDDDLGLVGRRALLGLKFKDDDERDLVRRVMIASASLVVLSVILYLVNVIHHGHVFEGFFHLLAAMSLPGIGYVGVKKESARLIWVFHLGNVQFALFHFIVGCLMLRVVLVVDSQQPGKICEEFNPVALGLPIPGSTVVSTYPGSTMPPPLQARVEAQMQVYNACLNKVKVRQAAIPGKLIGWGILTLPLWLCMIYAAVQAHEYYVRLRIRELKIRPGAGEATIVEQAEPDILVSDNNE